MTSPEDLKELFAPAIAENFDLNSQIDKVFTLYDGKSTSYEMDVCNEAGSGRCDGHYVFLEFNGELDNIQMDNGKIFSIYILRACSVSFFARLFGKFCC